MSRQLAQMARQLVEEPALLEGQYAPQMHATMAPLGSKLPYREAALTSGAGYLR